MKKDAWKSLGAYVLHGLSDDLLGEVLRELTFVGEGYGCYRSFDVRDDAREWTLDRKANFWADADYDDCYELARLGQGFTYELSDVAVDVCWFWDGDGTLCFVLHNSSGVVRALSNTDCKKDYGWRSEL